MPPNLYSKEELSIMSEEEEQSAGLSTAESPSASSMEHEGNLSGYGSDTNTSTSIVEGLSDINNKMKRTSLRSVGSPRKLSLSFSGSASLTDSAPTILVNTPDDESYHSVHRPLRSSMSSRTLHESLHRGRKPAQKKSRSKSAVSFDHVNIREYERILGDNPSCTSGPPLSIGWRFSPNPMVISVDDYEEGKGDIPRYKSQFLVPKAIREKMLKEHAGVSRREIVNTVRGVQKQKSQRRKTAANLGMQGTEEKVEAVRRSMQKAMGKRKSFSKEEKKLWEDAHERAVEKAKQLEASIRKGESVSLQNVYSVGTPTNCMLPSRRMSLDHNIETGLGVSSDEEAKVEEEAPTSSVQEVVSEGVGKVPVISQDPIDSEPRLGSEQRLGSEHSLRRSIVICEENDDADFIGKLLE